MATKCDFSQKRLPNIVVFYIGTFCFLNATTSIHLLWKYTIWNLQLFSALTDVKQMFSFWGFWIFCFQFVSFGCFGFRGVLIINTLKFRSRFSRRRSWCESYFVQFLTVVNTFSAIFSEKYFLSFVIPPFHLGGATALIINGLYMVELWVELGWNYMKFHPNSTHNSTLSNMLIIKHIIYSRWKGGTSIW